MRVFHYLKDIQGLEGCSVALGCFDSIHLGHQMLIRECVDNAAQRGAVPVLFTFSDIPANIISGSSNITPVLGIEERTEIVSGLGIEAMICAEFNKRMMSRSAENFIERVLVKYLHPGCVICGYNYTFGYMGEGKPGDLVKAGAKYGFDVIIVPEVTVSGAAVSSTRVRKALAEGNDVLYSELTGRSPHHDKK